MGKLWALRNPTICAQHAAEMQVQQTAKNTQWAMTREVALTMYQRCDAFEVLWAPAARLATL